MDLNKQQREIVDAWLVERNISAECPACGSVKIGKAQIVAIVPFDLESLDIVRGEVAPHVQRTCDNCGHSQFFSAKIVGLLT